MLEDGLRTLLETVIALSEIEVKAVEVQVGRKERSELVIANATSANELDESGYTLVPYYLCSLKAKHRKPERERIHTPEQAPPNYSADPDSKAGNSRTGSTPQTG